MFDFQKEITDLIRENVYIHLNINRKSRQSEKINCRCFICGDSKKDTTIKRGWIYFPNGGVPNYFCFNESCSAQGVGLLAKIQGTTNKQAFAQVVQRFRDRDDNFNFDGDDFIIDDDGFAEFNEPAPIEKEKEKFIIPADWLELDERATNIIESRKIMEAPFAPKNWKLYVSTKHARIVIPWVDVNGNIIGYQMRSIYKDQTPKYKFEMGSDKPIFISGSFDNSFPYIFVGEGIFDMIFVQNGCAIGGIKPTNKQLEILKTKYPFHEIILLLDNPWVDTASKKEIFNLYKKNKSQRIFMWDKNNKSKDINDDVISSNDLMKYDKKYLEHHIVSLAKAKIMLKFK